MNKLLIISLLCVLSLTSFCQETKTHANWQLLDPQNDKIYGAGVEKAYQLLKGRTPKEVIVAVIDGGVDINHEDLQGVIWTNTGEIPGNGIDDDHNGYVDDIHGWNFLGGSGGNIEFESTELARMYHRLNRKYANMDSTTVPEAQKSEYREYVKVKTKFNAEQMQNFNEMMVVNELNTLIVKIKNQNNGKLSRKAVKHYKPENEREKLFRKVLKLALLVGNAGELDKEITEESKHNAALMKFNALNTDSIRAAVVGDNPANASERYYGNNDVIGPDAMHGTHVAGIIAAIRNNNIGMNGVADHVKIMVLRAVPDGDERDKDIANAIRYAVDNHASVINMSFGKYYSPDKAVIDSAVRYAQAHDVLFIHAAGNESKNMDIEKSFPSDELLSGTTVKNWIEVGANDRKKGKKLLGSFSNYGKKRVDLFAPGVNIYSTGPNNTYINLSGTSMASPVTTGVAALIREYFPELKAEEVKEVMMKSVTVYKKKVKVPQMPGPKKGKLENQSLNELSVSGGVVNAANAVKILLKK
jgi:subtilisin family serine protease